MSAASQAVNVNLEPREGARSTFTASQAVNVTLEPRASARSTFTASQEVPRRGAVPEATVHPYSAPVEHFGRKLNSGAAPHMPSGRRGESAIIDAVSEWRLGRLQNTEQGAVAWDILGDGPPLVLVHGTPWSSFAWRQIAPVLSASWTVYFFDLPGFGASEKHAGQDVSLASLARVLGEMFEGWGLVDPVVVAHDIGGAIALRRALLHGGSFTGLALLDPVAISPWGSPFYRLVREHTNVFEALPPHIHTAVAEAYIRSALPTPVASEVLDALIDPWRGPEGQAALYRQIAQGDERHTDEFRSRLASLACPTLILWGEEDPWIPVQRAHELARLIPLAKLRTIPGAGHLIQEDAPGELLRHLLPFLAAANAAPPGGARAAPGADLFDDREAQ